MHLIPKAIIVLVLMWSCDVQVIYIFMKCGLLFHFWENGVLPHPQQFVADLPESYEKAKAAIHAAFPSVYDTKFMTFEVRKLLDKNDLYKWAGLLTHP